MQERKQMERAKQVCMILLLAAVLAGCGWKNLDSEKEEALDFTVVKEEDLPEAVEEILETKKAEPFQMSYQNEGYLYLMQGYGQQNSGGFSIQVKKLAATEDAIYFSTELLGPQTKEQQKGGVSCPYLVIKTQYRDLPVVFE